MTDEIFGFRTPPDETASSDSHPLRTIDEIVGALRRRASAKPRGRHAALALEALDELTSKTAERGTVRSLSGFTPSTLEPLVEPLGELAPRCDRDPWRRLVFALLGRIPVGIRKPAQVLQLALYAPLEVRPVLLAEYWHLVMAGIHHDPTYVLAVALDVWGDSLSQPLCVLVETLGTAANRRPQCSPWRIEPPRGSPLTAALDALEAVPDAFDFVRGWGLVQLRGILRESHLDRGLQMAQALSQRFDIQSETLRRWNIPPPAADSSLGPVVVGKIKVPCDFGGFRQNFPVYLGRPAPGFHRLHFQAGWLRQERAGIIPAKLMEQLC